jgi:DNA polymerase-1
LYIQQPAFSYHRETIQDPRYQTVTTPDQFSEAMNRLWSAKRYAADTETSGLDWHLDSRICGFAFGTRRDDGPGVVNYYIPFRHITGEEQLPEEVVLPAVKQLLERDDQERVWWHRKFDQHMCRCEGITLRGYNHDGMIPVWLYDENQEASLKHRALVDLGNLEAHVYEEVLDRETARLAKLAGLRKKEYKQRFGYSQIPIHMAGAYAGRDTDYTLGLLEFYESKGVIDYYRRSPRGPNARGIYDIETDLVDVLCEMEAVGVPIDRNYLLWLRTEVGQAKERIERQIWDAIGIHQKFNLGSDDELRYFLLNKLHLPLFKPTQGGDLAVDREVLEHFSDQAPVLKLVLDWRDAQKIESTYTDSILERLDKFDVLHGDYQQLGTDTGRLSCRDPNLQNISADDDERALAYCGRKLEDGGIDPWSIRRAFLSRFGRATLYIDYSQIELRVLAYYTRDPNLVGAYLRGEDIHEATSMLVFGTKEKSKRKIAKMANFGTSYCLTAPGLARRAKIPMEEADDFYVKFNAAYPRIASFREELWAFMRSNRGQFDNLWGRTRRIPQIFSGDNSERRRAERQAIGTCIQGTAAELTKESLVRLRKWFRDEGLDANLIETIHDEIQIDVSLEDLARVAYGAKWIMEDYPEFQPVPIVASEEYSTTHWAEKQELPN